jgi:uncharacterized protein (TIGR04206 family)
VPSPRRRALAVLVAGLLPWTVLLLEAGASLVFAFGLVNTDPLHLVTIYDYLFVHTAGLPRRLEAWPVGVVLHAGATACAVLDYWSGDGVDPRLTGGLLVVAGFLHAQVAIGLYRSYGAGGPLVVPLGALGCWTVAWWYYWPLVGERGIASTGD